MADTGFNSPTNATGDAPFWSNATNILSSDNNDATVSSNGYYCYGFDFGFDGEIPAGATIDGIEMTVEGANGTGAFTVNYSVDLSKDLYASHFTAAKSDTFTSTTDATDTFGGATDKWGESSWAVSDFNDANFACSIWRTAGTGILAIDHIQIKVYYTAATTTTSTSSTSTSTSSSSTTTVTQTLDPSSGGLAFGEQSPTEGETPISWQSFSDGAGGKPDVIGDQDWGKLALQLNEKGHSRVYDFGNSTERTYTLTSNRYGTGGGSGGVVYYRGHVDTYFAQDAGTPSWTEYSAPFNAEYQFIQVKVEKTS